jgi:hypothetical protein
MGPKENRDSLRKAGCSEDEMKRLGNVRRERETWQSGRFIKR